MKKITFLFVLLFNVLAFAGNSEELPTVTVVEITDTTMESVYYHQMNFTVPTKLVFINLTSVAGYVYFHQNQNLVEVDFPLLEQTGNYVYFHGNTSLETVNLPSLQSVTNYVYAANNTSLTTFNICALTTILPDPNVFGSTAPYYYFSGNTPSVDATPQCFSMGHPTNLALSNNTISENLAVNTLVGTFSADSNYPNGSLSYHLGDWQDDNNKFTIVGNELRTNSTFDFETDNEYQISVEVRNQLGESAQGTYTITISDLTSENLNVIEITDVTMAQVYYHQVSFTQPTKLVFTNLTSVEGIVYFHQNPNLVEVDFPLLEQTGNYFYFHGNQSLETLNAPNLTSVTSYLYVANNTALTTLDVCGLTQILPDNSLSAQQPYYYIHGNTATVDAVPTCFSIGAPTNLQLSNATVSENLPQNALIGTISASGGSTGMLTYYLDDHDADNDYFVLNGSELQSKGTFDFEARSEYVVRLGVMNQLGEFLEADFTVTIVDVATETLQIVEITDTNLDNVYYHQVSFTQPTRLVFTNLANVNGIVYFHGNVNIAEVDFPVLTQTGEYFYVYQNQSLTSLTAPNLQTVHNYLFVANNASLTELNVCELAQILPGQNSIEPYYYVENNPNLDFDTTCLVNTTITYTPVDVITILPAPNTLIGTFSSDADGPVTYFFAGEMGDEVTNTDFAIVGNGLYLLHEYEYYAEGDFEINIGAIRVNTSTDRYSSEPSSGLNEKISFELIIDITNATLGNPPVSGITKRIVLYPNPTQNRFEIHSTDDVQDVKIYDMSGRTLTNFIIAGKSVDISNFAQGNYVVVVKTVNNETSRKLVTKK